MKREVVFKYFWRLLVSLLTKIFVLLGVITLTNHKVNF